MLAAQHTPWEWLRLWLVLGRVSNLPTVWSNCLAAWLISGGGQVTRLLGVGLGTSLLYVGGMFLNDYLDAGFDREHRRGRPIPSGAVSAGWVSAGAWGSLAAGVLVLVFSGANHWMVVALVTAIIVYNLIHKATPLSPVVMGICRLLVYLLAGSVADKGVAGLAIWSGIALAAYVVGLSFVARQETSAGTVAWWPLVLLLTPVGLALVANSDYHREIAIGISLLMVFWVLLALGPTLGKGGTSTPAMVEKLIAGIVAVDLLAVGVTSPGAVLLFVAFFALTLLGQKAIPGS